MLGLFNWLQLALSTCLLQSLFCMHCIDNNSLSWHQWSWSPVTLAPQYGEKSKHGQSNSVSYISSHNITLPFKEQFKCTLYPKGYLQKDLFIHVSVYTCAYVCVLLWAGTQARRWRWGVFLSLCSSDAASPPEPGACVLKAGSQNPWRWGCRHPQEA